MTEVLLEQYAEHHGKKKQKTWLTIAASTLIRQTFPNELELDIIQILENSSFSFGDI
jgi:hypothetical protein